MLAVSQTKCDWDPGSVWQRWLLSCWSASTSMLTVPSTYFTICRITAISLSCKCSAYNDIQLILSIKKNTATWLPDGRCKQLLYCNLPDPFGPIMALKFLNGPIVWCPLYDLKLSSSIYFNLPGILTIAWNVHKDNVFHKFAMIWFLYALITAASKHFYEFCSYAP